MHFSIVQLNSFILSNKRGSKSDIVINEITIGNIVAKLIIPIAKISNNIKDNKPNILYIDLYPSITLSPKLHFSIAQLNSFILSNKRGNKMDIVINEITIGNIAAKLIVPIAKISNNVKDNKPNTLYKDLYLFVVSSPKLLAPIALFSILSSPTKRYNKPHITNKLDNTPGRVTAAIPETALRAITSSNIKVI